MPLRIQLDQIPDYEEVCLAPATRDVHALVLRWDSERVLRPRTQMLAMLAMNIGLGRIGADNIDEWEYRLAVWQKAAGAPLGDSRDKEHYLTRMDIEEHVGLIVNVTPMTRRDFKAHVFEFLEEGGRRLMEIEEDAVAERRKEHVNG